LVGYRVNEIKKLAIRRSGWFPMMREKADYLSALFESDKRPWQPLVEIWRKRFGAGEK